MSADWCRQTEDECIALLQRLKIVDWREAVGLGELVCDSWVDVLNVRYAVG